jgi:hypothetical protein
MPASARGVSRDASTPTSENAIGPWTDRHLQPLSHDTPSGTPSSAHTMESSSRVRVTDASAPDHAHFGTGSPGKSRHTASRSWSVDTSNPLI